MTSGRSAPRSSVSLTPEPEVDYVAHMFTAPEVDCPVCGQGLSITQWRERTIERFTGLHVLTLRDRRCTTKGCAGRKIVVRPPEELSFARKKDRIGLDVLFEIGELRLQGHLSFQVIHARLEARGVTITERAVSDAFQRYLALVNCRAGDTKAVREKLRKQGGMVVSIDGVQNDDHSAVLYVVSEVLSNTTLFAERHPTRSAEALTSLLKRLKAMDVHIIAFATDKETGLVAAIESFFPGVPHQFCQLHFAKRCAVPLRKPLKKLGKSVSQCAEKLGKIRRQLENAKPAQSLAEKKDRKAAADLLESAHAAAKVAGRAPFTPPALKRHEGLLNVGRTAASLARKGGSFSEKS